MPTRPTRLLLLLAPLWLGACSAEVQHVLARLDDDALSYRLTLTPDGPPDPVWLSLAERLPTEAPGATLRWWTDADGRFTLHARFDGVASYQATVDELLAALPADLTLPPGTRPPTVTDTGDAWTVSARTAPERWSLVLDGPTLVGEPTRRVAGRGLWIAPDAGPHVQASLRRDAPPGLADFLTQGGPALACAFAGLGLLVWVNRRTRRRLAAGAT